MTVAGWRACWHLLSALPKGAAAIGSTEVAYLVVCIGQKSCPVMADLTKLRTRETVLDSEGHCCVGNLLGSINHYCHSLSAWNCVLHGLVRGEFSRQIVIRSCSDKQLRILGPPAVACHRVRLPFQSCPLPEPRQNASSYDGRRLSGLLASAFGITQGSCSNRVNKGRVSSCLYRSEELSRNGRSH